MRNAQPVQQDRIHCDLLCRLRHSPHRRLCKGVLCVAFIRITHFHLSARQSLTLSQACDDTVTHLGHIGMCRDLLRLLFSDAFKGNLRVISGLPEGHLHQILVHTLTQHKECCEHQCGEHDRQHGHQIASLIVPEYSFV